MLSAVIGWIDYKPVERRPIASSLLSSIDFRLFSQAGFDSLQDDQDLVDMFDLSGALGAAKSYRQLRLDQRISW